jgi:hypothetical protein
MSKASTTSTIDQWREALEQTEQFARRYRHLREHPTVLKELAVMRISREAMDLYIDRDIDETVIKTGADLV